LHGAARRPNHTEQAQTTALKASLMGTITDCTAQGQAVSVSKALMPMMQLLCTEAPETYGPVKLKAAFGMWVLYNIRDHVGNCKNSNKQGWIFWEHGKRHLVSSLLLGNGKVVPYTPPMLAVVAEPSTLLQKLAFEDHLLLPADLAFVYPTAVLGKMGSGKSRCDWRCVLGDVQCACGESFCVNSASGFSLA